MGGKWVTRVTRVTMARRAGFVTPVTLVTLNTVFTLVQEFLETFLIDDLNLPDLAVASRSGIHEPGADLHATEILLDEIADQLASKIAAPVGEVLAQNVMQCLILTNLVTLIVPRGLVGGRYRFTTRRASRLEGAKPHEQHRP